MSTLLQDRHIEYVKLVLNKADGSGTTDVRCGVGFHTAENVFDSGNILWPLLVERPLSARRMGRLVAERSDIDLVLYAHNPFADNQTLAKMKAEDYEFHGSMVWIYYAATPQDAAVTYDADTHIRQTLEIVSAEIEGNEITIACRDTWFKNKEILPQFDEDTYPNAPERTLGELQPICIGQSGASRLGPVHNAWWIDVTTNNDGSAATAEGVLMAGYVPGFLQLDAFDKIYVPNVNSLEYNTDRWIEADIPASSHIIYGPDSVLVRGTWNLGQRLGTTGTGPQPCGIIYTNSGSTAQICSSVNLLMQNDNDVTWTGLGPIKCYVQHATQDADTSNWQTVGPILGEAFKDPQSADLDPGTAFGSSTPVEFSVTWDHPIVFAPGVSYYIAVTINLTSNGDPGGSPYVLYRSVSDPLWYQQVTADATYQSSPDYGHLAPNADEQLALKVMGWYVSDSDRGTDASPDNDYASIDIQTVCRTGDIIAFESLPLKVLNNGIEDDAAGSYTDVAYALIENPADVIYFLLRNSTDLGIGTTDIVEADFAAVRALCNNNINMAIETQISMEELITKICYEAHLRLYKNRRNDITINYPDFNGPNESADYVLDESKLRDEMQLVSYADSDYSELINDLKQGYAPDVLESITDPTYIRKAETTRYTGYEATNSDNSDKCSDSETLFDKREHRIPYDFFDTSPGPIEAQKYLVDRYTARQRRATVRVPRNKYCAVDLFDIIILHHSGIPSDRDASHNLHVYTDDHTSSNPESLVGGLALGVYHEGVPGLVANLGRLKGEVVAIEETGPYVFITIETTSEF